MRRFSTIAATAASVIFAIAAMAAPAQASPLPVLLSPAVSFTGLGVDFTNNTWSIGWEFTPNTSINVLELGIFDDGGNAGSVHAVGIYNSSQTLIASTSITQGTNLSNFFDWSGIFPVTLTAGDNYFIAEETGSSNYSYDNTGFTTDPAITFDTDAYVSSSTLAFPANSSGLTGGANNGWFGPNFGFAPTPIAVPEPSSIWLMASGLLAMLGVGFVARRRGAAAA